MIPRADCCRRCRPEVSTDEANCLARRSCRRKRQSIWTRWSNDALDSPMMVEPKKIWTIRLQYANCVARAQSVYTTLTGWCRVYLFVLIRVSVYLSVCFLRLGPRVSRTVLVYFLYVLSKKSNYSCRSLVLWAFDYGTSIPSSSQVFVSCHYLWRPETFPVRRESRKFGSDTRPIGSPLKEDRYTPLYIFFGHFWPSIRSSTHNIHLTIIVYYSRSAFSTRRACFSLFF